MDFEIGIRNAQAAKRFLNQVAPAQELGDGVLSFTAANGVPFNARTIYGGDHYGRYTHGEGFALTLEDDVAPIVEFYDARHDFSPYGQFVSRYPLDTLQQHRAGYALDLDGDQPSWVIDSESLEIVLLHASSHCRLRDATDLAGKPSTRIVSFGEWKRSPEGVCQSRYVVASSEDGFLAAIQSIGIRAVSEVSWGAPVATLELAKAAGEDSLGEWNSELQAAARKRARP